MNQIFRALVPVYNTEAGRKNDPMTLSISYSFGFAGYSLEGREG
jgi:hypothetical protein